MRFSMKVVFYLHLSIGIIETVWGIDSSHGTHAYLSNLTKSYVGGYGGNVPGLYTICSKTPRASLVSPTSVPIF